VVLQRLQDAGLKVNAKKFYFGTPELEWHPECYQKGTSYFKYKHPKNLARTTPFYRPAHLLLQHVGKKARCTLTKLVSRTVK
jgi:hypothetical protein